MNINKEVTAEEILEQNSINQIKIKILLKIILSKIIIITITIQEKKSQNNMMIDLNNQIILQMFFKVLLSCLIQRVKELPTVNSLIIIILNFIKCIIIRDRMCLKELGNLFMQIIIMQIIMNILNKMVKVLIQFIIKILIIIIFRALLCGIQ